MNNQHIGYLLKSITDKIKIRADANLKDHNLTLTQSRVLAYLSSRDGQATQKEIEDFLDVSHPTVVGIVTRMERNGFVRTWFDAGDKRNKIVSLTDSAKVIGQDMDDLISDQELQMLRGLTPEQVEELVRYLTVVYHNVNEPGHRDSPDP